MTDLEQHANPESDAGPSRIQSMALGDTKQDSDGGNVTNIPATIGLIGFFGFIGYLGLPYLLMALGIVVMIFLHELGHFMTAKWTGMKSTQFFIGFGPTIISRTRGEVEYGIKALPLGAFVRIIGMSNLDPVEPEDEPRAYRSKSYPRRMLVITAGSIMHFIQALIIFAIAISVVGLRDPAAIGHEADAPLEWSVGEISRLETGETPSIEAGIDLGDKIVAIDGVATESWGDVVETIQSMPGEAVTLTVLRSGETFDTDATLAAVPTDDGGEIGFLGVYRTFERQRLSPLVAVEATATMGRDALTFIPQLFSPTTFGNLGSLVLEGSEDVDISSDEAQGRPISLVGAVRISGEVAQLDWVLALLFLAQINVFVGILNLVPLLPLDGGHAAIATYERIRSRRGRPYRADIAKLIPLTYAVVAVFAFIGLTTIWLDIVRPISS